MGTVRFKVKTYLVVETKSPFILSIAKEILPDTYILEIMEKHDNETMVIKGTKDYRLFKVDHRIYNDMVVLETIITIPN